jgi:hypothetical protein
MGSVRPVDTPLEPRTVDEINEGVRQALAALRGGELAAISYLTGIPADRLIELGGVYDPETDDAG